MAGLLKVIVLIVGVVAASTGGSSAQERVTVTVRQLFDRAHRIEVPAGAEVLWADPHFDRVWFPAGSGAPAIERMPGGFRARFTTPGTYRGTFTVTGGHATNDVYNLVVVVASGSR